MLDTTMSSPLLSTLLASDLVGSTRLTEQLGDERSAAVFQRHDRVARDLLSQHGGQEIDKTDGFLILFDRPISAVRYAIAYHDQLATLSDALQVPLQARVGIHVGEVIRRANTPADVARGAKPVEVEGIAKPMVARIMSVASGRQTLLTRVAFDLARRGTPQADGTAGTDLTWLAHGSYVFQGVTEAVEVYEVGREGMAPLAPPADTGKVQRILDLDTITGWRPAPGIEVPHRPNWVLEEKVGAGGFGDVWRAEHKKTHEKRVYKFCYDGQRLSGLKREVTLVRLLKEELGDRRDIVRILDWNFEEAPYFLEAEWSAAGNLDEWARAQGGLTTVPMSTRLEIVAQIADALAAAHSVGVLHKDIKSSNILMSTDGRGGPQAQLADFGIGLVTDRTRLEEAGITQVDFTEIDAASALTPDGTATAGTRLYMAPELMEGKPSTVHADVYSLGVVLYQMVVGDLTRALGSGWERDVEDPLVREDIAAAVDRNPERRLDPRALADCLRRLDARHASRAREEHAQAKVARTRRRLRWAGLVGAGLLLVAVATGAQLRRVSLESARANREAETSRRVTEFLIDLFRVADPGETQGNTVTAREILDAGAERISKGLEDQPDVQAALMGSMGQVYLGLGLPAVAMPLLEQSLDIRKQLHGDNSLEVAEGLRLLGLAASDAGNLDTAETTVLNALDLATARVGPDAPQVAEILSLLSRIRWLKGDYAGGDTVGARAIALYRQHGIHSPALGLALLSQASVQFFFNHLTEAETLLREALVVMRDAYGPGDRRVADVRNNLGHILTSQGKYAEARPLVDSALSVYRRLLGNQHQSVGVASTALGLLLQEQGEVARAETLFRDALSIFQGRFGADNLFTVGAMKNLASIQADQGKCDGAEPIAREALEIGLRTSRPEWALAEIRSVLGKCLVVRGRYAEAEPILLESYTVIANSVGGLSATAALRPLVMLYERSGQPAKTAEYRDLLQRRQ